MVLKYILENSKIRIEINLFSKKNIVEHMLDVPIGYHPVYVLYIDKCS